MQQFFRTLTKPLTRYRHVVPIVAVLLAVLSLVLALGGYYLTHSPKPNHRITTKTVDSLAEVPLLIRHDGFVGRIRFRSSSDAPTSLVSVSYDGVVKVWDVDGAKAAEQLAVHVGGPPALNADSQQLARADQQGIIKLWNLTQAKQLFDKLPNKTYTHAVAFSPDGHTLVSGESDGSIQLWDWQRHTSRVLHKQPDTELSALAFSSPSSVGSDVFLASGNSDGKIHIWDWQSRKLLGSLTPNLNYILSMAFSPDGQILAIKAKDPKTYQSKVELWNWRNNQQVQSFVGSNFAWSPNGQTLAIANDQGITLRNVNDGIEGVSLPLARGPVTFSRDGQMLASSSEDSTVQLWDSKTGKPVADCPKRINNLAALRFSPDGETLIGTGFENDDQARLTLWKITDNQACSESLSLLVEEATQALHSLAVNAKAQKLAIGGQSIKLLPLNYESKLATTLQFTLNKGFVGGFPSDQQLILVDNNYRSLKQLNPMDKNQTITDSFLTLKSGEWMSNGVFSPNGDVIAVSITSPTPEARRVELWDLTDRKLMYTFKSSNKESIRSMAFGQNGQKFVGVSWSKVFVWDVKERQPSQKQPEPSKSWAVNRVSAVACNPDGDLLVTGDENGEIKLWDLKQRSAPENPLRTLKSHGAWINDLTFSPDGQILASASDDYTVKLWRVNGGDSS